jgi:hypothetical protein
MNKPPDQPTEIALKQFCIEEAEKLGKTDGGVYHMIYDHGYKYPKASFRRVNKRVVFVTLCQHKVCKGCPPVRMRKFGCIK